MTENQKRLDDRIRKLDEISEEECECTEEPYCRSCIAKIYLGTLYAVAGDGLNEINGKSKT